jgi:hypothetical protein
MICGRCGYVLQALELQAGMALDGSSGQEAAVSQQQWDDFLSAFQDRLKLLRLIANVSSPASLLDWWGAVPHAAWVSVAFYRVLTQWAVAAGVCLVVANQHDVHSHPRSKVYENGTACWRGSSSALASL